MHIFSGQYKGRTLQTPTSALTRPTSGRMREALFNILQGSIEDATFLDLFAGTGAMGLEALSRGAASATFIENNQDCIRCVRANIESLNVKAQTHILYGDVFKMLDRLMKEGKQYTYIYADPPYEASKEGVFFSHVLLAKLDAWIDTGDSLLAESGLLFIEEADKALAEIQTLNHLKLKSSRKMGRSGLHQYERQ